MPRSQVMWPESEISSCFSRNSRIASSAIISSD
uniref:Putative phenylalaninetRNA ligase alpha subunit n=1 Tax=Rhizophora mucronata TaxID=61149 RepID=A0A2P2KNA9_RHIMU